MNTFPFRLFALLVALNLPPIYAQKEKSAEFWIEQLANENFAQRELAKNKLLSLGNNARQAIEKGIENTDPEIAQSCQDLLDLLSLGISGNISEADNKTLKEILQAINRNDKENAQTLILKLADTNIAVALNLAVKYQFYALNNKLNSELDIKSLELLEKNKIDELIAFYRSLIPSSAKHRRAVALLLRDHKKSMDELKFNPIEQNAIRYEWALLDEDLPLANKLGNKFPKEKLRLQFLNADLNVIPKILSDEQKNPYLKERAQFHPLSFKLEAQQLKFAQNYLNGDFSPSPSSQEEWAKSKENLFFQGIYGDTSSYFSKTQLPSQLEIAILSTFITDLPGKDFAQLLGFSNDSPETILKEFPNLKIKTLERDLATCYYLFSRGEIENGRKLLAEFCKRTYDKDPKKIHNFISQKSTPLAFHFGFVLIEEMLKATQSEEGFLILLSKTPQLPFVFQTQFQKRLAEKFPDLPKIELYRLTAEYFGIIPDPQNRNNIIAPILKDSLDKLAGTEKQTTCIEECYTMMRSGYYPERAIDFILRNQFMDSLNSTKILEIAADFTAAGKTQEFNNRLKNIDDAFTSQILAFKTNIFHFSGQYEQALLELQRSNEYANTHQAAPLTILMQNLSFAAFNTFAPLRQSWMSLSCGNETGPDLWTSNTESQSITNYHYNFFISQFSLFGLPQNWTKKPKPLTENQLDYAAKMMGFWAMLSATYNISFDITQANMNTATAAIQNRNALIITRMTECVKKGDQAGVKSAWKALQKFPSYPLEIINLLETNSKLSGLRSELLAEKIKELKSELRRWPNSAQTAINLATCLALNKQYLQGVEILTAAIKADPLNEKLPFSLAKVHVAAKNLTEAKTQIINAYKLNPTDIKIRQEHDRILSHFK